MITPSFGLTATERVLPRLALDFTTASLDPRITFVRSGNTATVTNSSGVIVAVNANIPRFDYNPTTLASLGLLIEEQRTNLLTYSEQFNNAAWGKTNVTVTANTVVSPDGTVNADKLIATTTNALHIIDSSSASLTSGSLYTASVYAKKGETSFLQITFSSAAIPRRANFDLNAGVTGTVDAGITASIINVGDGWYRCIATGTSDATGSYKAVFGLITSATSGRFQAFAGNDYSGIYIWGAQLEAGAFATSYIPTAASQVTRTADQTSMTGTNFSSWSNSSAGGLVVECDNGQGAIPAICSVDGTSSPLNRIAIYQQDATGSPANVTKYRIWSSGTVIVDFNLTRVSGGYGFAGQTDSYAGSVNGGAVSTDSSGTFPVLSALYFYDPLNGRYLNGHVRSFYYWPQRITNNEVQAFSKG